MKKIVAGSILIIILFISCKKDEITQPFQVNEFIQIQKDSTVMKLLKLNYQLLQGMGDSLDSILPLFKKKQNTYLEKLKIANTLGFKSIQEYEKFFEIQVQLIHEIKLRYPFIIKSTKLQPILVNILASEKSTTIKVHFLENRCEGKYNNCMRLANVVYTAEILGCTASAIGIGSVTFGLGGVAFQLACGGIALEHLATMRTGCDLDYQDCH